MKLRYSPTSPYVRKVMVVAIETGLEERLERVPTDVWNPASDIRDQNPLAKVPVLVGDDGQVLFDSPVICEYLDSLHGGARVFPPEGAARWSALRMQALADGLLDAAVLRRHEELRPAPQRSPEWIERQRQAMSGALDMLERQSVAFGRAPDIGLIAAGCALGYLDFRFAQDDWRATRPRLSQWYAHWRERPSMRETEPRETGT